MINATLIVNDLTKVYGTSAPLTATLKDGNTFLSGKTIVFTINGVDYTRTTDDKGKASLNINLNAGTYPTKVRFIGDSTYNQIVKQVVVRVINSFVPAGDVKTTKNYFEVNKIPLHVIMSSGFDVTTGQNIKETQLLHDEGNNNSPTFYFNLGYDGDEFEVSILMKEQYYYNGQQVMSYLNAWNKTNIVVSVVTDSMIVANGKYTMQIKNKTQTIENQSIWKLRFKQFYENNLSFENVYEEKTTTLSAIDNLLLKQINGINAKSGSEIIKALQMKLQEYGYLSWSYPGADGNWSQSVEFSIHYFQEFYMDKPEKNGFCDYETITGLVNYTRALPQEYVGKGGTKYGR